MSSEQNSSNQPMNIERINTCLHGDLTINSPVRNTFKEMGFTCYSIPNSNKRVLVYPNCDDSSLLGDFRYLTYDGNNYIDCDKLNTIPTSTFTGVVCHGESNQSAVCNTLFGATNTPPKTDVPLIPTTTEAQPNTYISPPVSQNTTNIVNETSTPQSDATVGYSSSCCSLLSIIFCIIICIMSCCGIGKMMSK